MTLLGPVAADPASRFERIAGDVRVSFEVFPPKCDTTTLKLWKALEVLETLGPRFVSVTYGAGGSTRERTLDTVARLAAETSMTTAAHLTCVGAPRAAVDDVARHYWDRGVRHIVAIRGDSTEPGQKFAPHPEGYASAAELVAGLRSLRPFEISVACYPESHPEARNRAADIDNLWRKIDAGATRAISQFFFSSDCFLRFRDQVAALGLDAEIVPGILPIASMAQTRRFAEQCGASIPLWIARLFDKLDDQPDSRNLVAATVAAELCAELYAGGVRNFHFYTLNRAELTYAVCHLLGLRAHHQRQECSHAA